MYTQVSYFVFICNLYLLCGNLDLLDPMKRWGPPGVKFIGRSSVEATIINDACTIVSLR